MTVDKKQILEMNAFAQDADEGMSPLLTRRLRNAGASSVLFYQRPLELVSAQGCWVRARDGRNYLDLYNNVASVGHCHPQVVAAISEQVATLNINSRYLSAVTESYSERLRQTLPVPMDHLVMTCSGSEANDLALRIARNYTDAYGVIVTEHAYHGNTAAVTDISPASFNRDVSPRGVERVAAPSKEAYGDEIAAGFARAVLAAIARLKANGYGVAAFICDSVCASDGVFVEPKGFLAPAVAAVQAAGGLYIADEVQPGFARTGESFWGFARHGVRPDMVTLGKPMGNGYPVAGLLVQARPLAAFCAEVGYFNTFGGTPAAAAAATAVLAVIEAEQLQSNAHTQGLYLKAQLAALAKRYPVLGEVRGAGLFLGIDVLDADSGMRSAAAASQLISQLCEQGVLIGATGSRGDILKIRPPLSLSRQEADYFLHALEKVLGH